MLRIVARGIAAIFLEVATATVTVAVVLLILSALVTAKFVGVDPKLNRRIALVMRILRDAGAIGMSSRRAPDAEV